MVSNDDNEVVISGIGGNFPKSKNIEEFTEILFKQENVVETARWESVITDKPDVFGVVDQINYFDASYFGIHRQQTLFMDPLGRMALENTFEALIDAGVNPASVRGKKVAVIIGSTLSENDSLMFESVENGFGVTGQARTMLANRISYWMNVTGPSYSLDHSWLGGLQALKNGYEAIKEGHCDSVIVGGVNLTMNMFPHHLYKILGVISPDGQTRAFDENANGYLRSEGIIMFYLQKAKDAKRNYANILDIDIMYNGNRTGNYAKMNADSARRFLTNFYQRANIDPSQVEYMETYGCGIKALDEFEIDVIDSVFKRTKDNPLLIGSVKSNVGHSDAAATFMGIVKTIIAMEKGEIPGNRGFEKVNSKIAALRDGRIKLVSKHTPWPGTLAAINGFGLATSFGHLLLKSGTRTKKSDTRSKKTNLPHLYIVSTRTEDGMREIVDKLKSQTSLNDEFLRLVSEVFSGHITGHLYRGYLVAKESETGNEIANCAEEISHYSGSHRSIWFVYSGMGSQWISMGKDLLRLPIFAAAIAKCHAILEPHGINLTEIITSRENPDMFNNILHSFVGIAAIQIGLTDILLAIGIKPDYMLGHSVGEMGCAYADGCLTAEQMILAAYYRGRASMEVELTPGLMAAVGMGASKMQELLPDAVDIACRNGPDSCTVSGPAEAMRQLVSTLQSSGVFARLVDVAGIAYHSRYIKPAAPLLLNYLKKVIPNPKVRSSKWLSTSVPEANGGWESERVKYASAEYLTNNLLSCVYFEEALTHVPSDTIVIEIAPHGLLQAILKRSLDSNSINITLTKRDQPKGVEFLMTNLGKLFLAGIPMQIYNLYKEVDECTPKCCPKNTPSLAPLVRWNHTETWRTGVDEFKDNSNSECTYMLDINTEMFNDLDGHRIFKIGDDAISEGTIIVPVTTFFPLVCGILSNVRRIAHIIFEDVHLLRHRVVPEAINIYIPPFRIMAQRGTGYFEVNDRYGLIAVGRYTIPLEQDIPSYLNDTAQQNLGKKLDELTKKEVYREFLLRGHIFQSTFKAINKLEIYESGMIANIEWKTGWHMFAAAMLQMSTFREGKFHREPFDVYYIQSLSNSFLSKNIPKEGTNLEVVYNFVTNRISSSIITIEAPRCRPYQIESNALIAEQCYTPELKATEAQINPNTVAVVNIGEGSIRFEDLTSDADWALELKQLLLSEYLENIYLICRTIPKSAIDKLLAAIRSLQNGHTVRLVLILDNSAPPFKGLTDSFYQPVFRQQDYSVAIYASGKWEFRLTIFSKLDAQNTVHNELKTIIAPEHIRRQIPETNIKYVGINNINVVPNVVRKGGIAENPKLSIVDYCGIDTKSSVPIMGLATISENNDLAADPILKWSIPKQWSFIDGATVPYAYTLAFYALNELVSAKAGECVLIHNGCSSLGQAMIRVAHSLGCYIYTTVASEKQRVVLMNHMRMIRSGSIFSYTTANFEMDIMTATKGEGIDILVNCLPGELLKSGLRCLAPLGRVIHLIDENESKDYYKEKIGLGTFLRVTGMYGVRASRILDLPDDMKMQLRDRVTEALKMEQIIIPIRRNIIRDRSKLQLEDVASYLCGPKVTGGVVIPIDNLTKKIQLTNNPVKYSLDESCYIIYGGEMIENTITLTHWLAITYGAKHIVLLTSNNQSPINKKFLQRNLSIIKSKLPAICIESIEVPDNKQDVVMQQTIKQLKLKNIAGVLILSGGNKKTDETLIKALQVNTTTHIVLLTSMSNTELNNTERYLTSNLKNISFVRWNKKRRFVDVLGTLPNALEETTDIFVRCDAVDEEDIVVTNFSFEDYCDVLMTSIPTFSKWSPPSSEITVEQVISSCPKRMSESPPVFLIPGLFGVHCSYLNTCIRNILSPLFVLDGDYSKSLEQLAIRLGKEVHKIYPYGIYNIIGVSTGGALAIELVKHLETAYNATVQLYLLDGAPQTIKNMVVEKNNYNSYEIVLLKTLLNIEDAKTINALTNAPPNWNARVNAVLRNSIDKDKQTKLLFALKHRLDAALKHEPNKSMVNGITRLLKPLKATKENTKLTNYCNQVKIEVIKGNHFTMLQAFKLAEYINNNVIVPKIYD